ncbi:MAG: hypothetical protein EPO07_11820 [Verrucomicrobia bacterium]|nr:MAG: hypothetical protein EPO07_11820 [Verrucomicrobiota bacterium]
MTASAFAADRKIVFLAGPPSHPPGQHEYRADCLLLKSCLDQFPGITSVVCSNGWPADGKSVFDGAAAIIVFTDGGWNHPLLQEDHLEIIGQLMRQGVGLACVHYAIEPTKEKGEQKFLDWIGGCFEVDWSVNPRWTAEIKSLPSHPITRGVKPFALDDEWYFHMRFPADMKGVTPILSAVAPPNTMRRADGPHEGNPAVRESVKRGEPQNLAWAFERADSGRGFGLTGAHFHESWGNDNFRKLALNAILWVAKVEVPPDGVKSTVTAEQLKENLDDKSGRRK